MRVQELIAELQTKNPNSKVYLMDEEGETVKAHKLYYIDDKKTPKENQDFLLMPYF